MGKERKNYRVEKTKLESRSDIVGLQYWIRAHMLYIYIYIYELVDPPTVRDPYHEIKSRVCVCGCPDEAQWRRAQFA